VYYHRGRDLLMVLYTDDQFVDGYREDVDWYYSLLRKRLEPHQRTTVALAWGVA